jgi:Photoprotection regulator fluorescence recovery protein
MNGLRDLHWSPTEKKAARKAFDAAYERECRAISSKLKQIMADDSDPSYVWRVHDYLFEQRRDVDRKYDYRYSVLIEVFARLLSEGWLSDDDLSGLNPEKIERIKALADFFSGQT